MKFKIGAKPRISASYIDVVKKERYSFKAHGCWVDMIIPCGPNGWKLKKVFGKEPRLKGVPFFTLCGNISNDEVSFDFPIGKELLEYEIPVSGTLRFFANDIYYWNNWGSVRLELEKIEEIWK